MASPVSYIDPRPSGTSGTAMRTHLEVHDLQNENRNRQIDEIIRAGNAVTFSPDTLAQAHSEGYDNCSWCLAGSQR